MESYKLILNNDKIPYEDKNKCNNSSNVVMINPSEKVSKVKKSNQISSPEQSLEQIDINKIDETILNSKGKKQIIKDIIQLLKQDNNIHGIIDDCLNNIIPG